jgi:DNA-binding transcriptional regulator GbsR (MarR family)
MKKALSVETADNDKSFELDDSTSRFIEEVGALFERYSGLRAMGRIVGLLLVANRPLNADEIGKALKMSRSGVSTNMQTVLSADMAQVVPRRYHGHRREYYEIAPGTWERIFMDYENRARNLKTLALSGLQAVPSDNTLATTRLQEMLDLSEYFLNLITGFAESWRNHKAQMAQNNEETPVIA